MRKIVLTLASSAIILSSFLVAFAQELPETVVLDACADKRAPVTFPHQAHVELTECTTCHHTSEGLTAENCAEMEVMTCTSCHLKPEEGVPDCSSMSLTKNAYHINCVGCHKESIKAAPEGTTVAAPTKCDECHPKS
ncbi:MAG: cytochrome c3 family protein [Candidatus Krumholzibacteriia bacterium]